MDLSHPALTSLARAEVVSLTHHFQFEGQGRRQVQLNRLRERYPEVFEKELDRLRELYEGGVPNWYPTLTVRGLLCAAFTSAQGPPTCYIAQPNAKL